MEQNHWGKRRRLVSIISGIDAYDATALQSLGHFQSALPASVQSTVGVVKEHDFWNVSRLKDKMLEKERARSDPEARARRSSDG